MPFGQQVFWVTKAQGEPVIQPHRVTYNDFRNGRLQPHSILQACSGPLWKNVTMKPFTRAVVPIAALSVSISAADVPTQSYRIANAYPHDTQAYTQGLLFHDGKLYESTGRRGASSVRRVDLTTGEVEQIETIPDKFYAEGLALLDDKLIQLTWQSGSAFVYDADSLRLNGLLNYAGEGWGLTTDGEHLIMSNGSDVLLVRDPETFGVVRHIPVTLSGSPLRGLNELEWVNGEIWANIWKDDRIARIDYDTGVVTALIDLKGIYDYSDNWEAVPNGIAWDAAQNRIFVTGKLWPEIYQIEIVE